MKGNLYYIGRFARNQENSLTPKQICDRLSTMLLPKCNFTNCPIGNISLVTLTQGKYAVVDTVDYDAVSRYKWAFWSSRKHSLHYAVRVTRDSKGKCCTIPMHRFLLDAPKDRQVDHRNGDGLDNRRCNLRLATAGQNQHNSTIPKNNTSGYKGVRRRDRQRFYAVIHKLDKKTTIGPFLTAKVAAIAYDREARKLFGNFARLNFPRLGEMSCKPAQTG